MSSNNSEDFKVQANNANTSNHYNNNNKQHSSKTQRQTSTTSVIPTFFRWFKKPNHRKHHQQFHSNRSAIEPSLRRYDSSSRESLNFNSSQNYLENHLSPSLSCDSVVSTSTTGFAFIKPNKYGNFVEPKILSDSQIDTNSIRRLKRTANDINPTTLTDSNLEICTVNERAPKLTLKQKYFLFESDTLKSTVSANDTNLEFFSSQAYGNYDNVPNNKSTLNYQKSHIDQEHFYVNNKGNSEEPILPTRRHRSRRTVSDSSKELQSGAYVHVKGKRKAPDPPSNTNSIVSTTPTQQSSNPFEESYVEPNLDNYRDNYRTLSPVSTFGRKKRKAPPPPLLVELQTNKLNFVKQSSKSPLAAKKISPPKDSFAEETILGPPKKTEIKIYKSFIISNSNKVPGNNGIETLLNNSDIKVYTNICEGNNQPNQSQNIEIIDSNQNYIDSNVKMPMSPAKHNIQMEVRSPIKTSQNKDGHFPENLKLLNNTTDLTNDSSTPPHSPISPRPWYKRPMSTNKESVIPFKREVVLKTMEKRKSKQKDSLDSGLPEVSFSRSSIFDSTGKFNLFSRQKDSKNAKDNKEKRLSSINMPNISELDREATEILMNESKHTNWNENKSYNPPEHLKLHQEMFGASNIINGKEISDQENIEEDTNINSEKSLHSTKDLINKFEIQTEGPKVTVNTSYIGKTEHFIASSPKSNISETTKEDKTVQKIDSKVIENDLKNLADKKNEKETIAAQEEIEKENKEQSKGNDHNLLKLTWSCSYCTLENPNWRIICEVCEHLKPFQKNSEETNINAENKQIKKTDVGKLIRSMPTSPQNFPSSAQDWEWKAEIVKKYFQKQDSTNSCGVIENSTNSPKLQSILRKSPSPSRLPINSPRTNRKDRYAQNISEIQTTETSKKPKDLNHQISKDDISSINLEQIRVARLAKFSIPPPLNSTDLSKISTSLNEDKTNFLNDPNSLEMEKKRLREKIRAMNAKALAEKYPIVKKSLSLDDPTMDSPISFSERQYENCKEQQRPVSSVIDLAPQPSIESANKKQNNCDKLENSSTKKLINQENQKSLNAIENILDVLQENCPEKLQSSKTQNTSNLTKLSSPNVKSGAIKKVFVRSLTTAIIEPLDKNLELKLQQKSANPKSLDEIYVQQNKPNKVSSSCQTSTGLVKKSENIDSTSNAALNALVSPIKGHKFRNGNLISDISNTSKLNNLEYIKYQKLSEFDKEQVKEISKKLTSIEGRNNFKMILDENQDKSISRTDTLVLNKILRNLEQAISEGKHELAAKLAMDLAKMKVSLQVTKSKPKKSLSFDEDMDQNFIVDMFIEDRISQKGPIQISIKPSMTVRELKEKAYKDFNIPIHLQKWIINEELLYNENLTLYDCGVKNNLANLYLYLLSPSAANGCNEDSYKFTIPKSSKAFHEDDLSDHYSTDSLDLHDNNGQKGATALKLNSNIKKSENFQNEKHILKSFNTPSKELPWECPLCTLINDPLVLACSACSKTKPLTRDEKSSISEELRKFLKGEGINKSIVGSNNKLKLNDLKTQANDISKSTATTTITITSSNNNNKNYLISNTPLLKNNFNYNNKDSSNKVLLRPNEQKNDLNKTSPNRKSTEIYNIIEEVIKPTPGNLTETKANPMQEKHQQRIVSVNFSSPNITKNKYRGVDNFNPFRKDTNDVFLQDNRNSNELSSQNIKTEITSNLETSTKSIKDPKSKNIKPLLKSPYSTSHYLELLKLDYSDVVRNFEEFECPICFCNIQCGGGIVLRECLHTFCKECLANTIKFNEEAQVKCPYMDKEYSCNIFLQEREIKSLVTKEIYEKHLAKSIKLAEHHIENAFHCKTANCRGWCIYEDNVNEFLCPVCNLKNCLTCGAIHDGITCKQYQDGLNDCDSNEDAKRTKEMFQEMVEKGEALNCPTCQVIMMKKWGCDWLKCSMCKTEVCWVTKGPRWGPAGKGDVTGGCKCGVNGVKCHPKCNYCH